MNLMFSYSRAVADQRLGHPPMADSVRKTSEKLVGPYLSRPLTSPSCGAPRHPAPALIGVGCERVSGTRMDTLVDDLGNIEKSMNTKTKQKIVYSAGEGYLSTGAAAGCKAGPAASSSSNRGRPGVGRHDPGCALTSGEEDTGTSRGGTRRQGGLHPTTKRRCVLPLRSLRGHSASGHTGGSQEPLRAPPLPPTVATVTRDAARGGGTRPRGIRTPRGEHRHRYRYRGRGSYCGRRRR